MLRNLVFALVAANLLYFAWSHWAETRQRPAAGSGVQQDLPVADAGAQTNAPAATPGAAIDAANPATAAPVCTSLGPFTDGVAADRAAALLAGAGKTSRPRSAETPQADGYWVFVGGLRDAAEQRRTLAALKRAGIDDSFAMPDDAQFRVSVGIFSERERAEQRARRILALALDSKVEEHFKLQATRWLDVAGATPAALQAPQLALLGITDATLTTAVCP